MKNPIRWHSSHLSTLLVKFLIILLFYLWITKASYRYSRLFEMVRIAYLITNSGSIVKLQIGSWATNASPQNRRTRYNTYSMPCLNLPSAGRHKCTSTQVAVVRSHYKNKENIWWWDGNALITVIKATALPTIWWEEPLIIYLIVKNQTI